MTKSKPGVSAKIGIMCTFLVFHDLVKEANQNSQMLFCLVNFSICHIQEGLLKLCMHESFPQQFFSLCEN